MTQNDMNQDSAGDDLVQTAQGLGVTLSLEQADQMLAYLRAVLEENQFINVTSIREYETAITHHLLDSLSLVQVWQGINPDRTPQTVLDLGTGGGFPAIPLALTWPECSVTAIDGTGKKIALVKRCLEATGISNVEAIQARGLDFPRQQPVRRKSYNLAVARAVGASEKLLRELAPLVCPGGHIYLMKGPVPPDSEILAARKLMHQLGLEHYELKQTTVPGLETRTILTFTKR